MSARLTPGPWEVHDQGFDTNGQRYFLISGAEAPDPTTEARYMFLARVSSVVRKGAVLTGWKEISHSEAEANAYAIAAVPELLAACQAAEPWLGKLIADGGHKGAAAPNDAVATLARLTDAIAKALAKVTP